MATILVKNGWRLFVYSNEVDDPPHIHAHKEVMECKFWLIAAEFDIEEAYTFDIGQADRRQVRQIVFENFEYLLAEYQKVHEDDEHEGA